MIEKVCHSSQQARENSGVDLSYPCGAKHYKRAGEEGCAKMADHTTEKTVEHISTNSHLTP